MQQADVSTSPNTSAQTRKARWAATNLLPNLAIGDAAADHLHNPLLDLFHLDVHVSSTLVESQDSLKQR